jgi:hypothetical protein
VVFYARFCNILFATPSHSHSILKDTSKNSLAAGCQWLMLAILAIWEAGIGKMAVPGYLGWGGVSYQDLTSTNSWV